MAFAGTIATNEHLISPQHLPYKLIFPFALVRRMFARLRCHPVQNMLNEDIYNLNSILVDNVQVDRSFIEVGGRQVVLFHKYGQSLQSEVATDYVQLMHGLELGPVCELFDENWSWCQANPRNFNCHAMAIGSAVGITPNDWLEGQASDSTSNSNPVGILLNEFYSPATGEILDNDVFVFRNSLTDHFVHSGFVRYIDDQLMAISKFGEAEIFVTTLELLATVFQDEFNELNWHRLNSNWVNQHVASQSNSSGELISA